MGHHKIEHEAQCASCEATGLYVGFAEKSGVAVQCRTCKGTGKVTVTLEWDDFDGRQERDGVTRVFEVNPGIVVGEGETDGGLSVEDWRMGKKFTPGTEMRSCTCPAWWYQSANYSLKPSWDECARLGSFYQCKHFANKALCWERFDRDQAAPPPESED